MSRKLKHHLSELNKFQKKKKKMQNSLLRFYQILKLVYFFHSDGMQRLFVCIFC